MTMRTHFRPLVSFVLLGTAGLLTGCDTLARSQGKFTVVNALGEKAIPDDQGSAFPSDAAWRDSRSKPLIKIGYRNPFTGKLIDLGTDSKESRQSYYMIVDVTNAIKNPRLGAGDDAEYRKRLHALADLLLVAADWNGEVYWRHLTTFLETYDSANKASRAALGAAIAATFISPVLGASLAGVALVTDTFVTDYTGQINVDVYAALREATSLTRERLRNEISRKIIEGETSGNSLSDVFALAYDYSFTYSIKGALHAVKEQKDELRNLLITGESTWKAPFADETLRYNIMLLEGGKITDPTKKAAIKKAKEARDKRREAEAVSQNKIDEETRKTREHEAETKRLKAEEERNMQKRKTEESKPQATPQDKAISRTFPSIANTTSQGSF